MIELILRAVNIHAIVWIMLPHLIEIMKGKMYILCKIKINLLALKFWMRKNCYYKTAMCRMWLKSFKQHKSECIKGSTKPITQSSKQINPSHQINQAGGLLYEPHLSIVCQTQPCVNTGNSWGTPKQPSTMDASIPHLGTIFANFTWFQHDFYLNCIPIDPQNVYPGINQVGMSSFSPEFV